MKIYRYMGFWAVWVFFTASLAWTGDESRVFIDVKGRSIEGRLIECSPFRERVTIQRADSKTYEVPISLFSEEDQKFFRDQILLNPLKVCAKLKNFANTETFNEKRYKPEYIKCLGFEIVLENRLGAALKNVDVEYCIFYQQEGRNQSRRICTNGIQCGGVKIGPMTAGSRHELKTETVLVYDEKCQATLFGSIGGTRGEVQGIWVRVVVTLPDGEKVTQEFQCPQAMEEGTKWTTTSVLAGLNAEKVRRLPTLPRRPIKKFRLIIEK